MVGTLFLQVDQAKEILEIGPESITIFGVLLLVIAGLLYHIFKLEKNHEKEREVLREEVKSAQKRLDHEYEENNSDLKKLAENYHIFSTRIFEKLNTILNIK